MTIGLIYILQYTWNKKNNYSCQFIFQYIQPSPTGHNYEELSVSFILLEAKSVVDFGLKNQYLNEKILFKMFQSHMTRSDYMLPACTFKGNEVDICQSSQL